MTVSTIPRTPTTTTDTKTAKSTHAHEDSNNDKKPQRPTGGVWWINGAFVVLVHVIASITPIVYPIASVPWQTWLLAFASWQLATLGITAGYHRLWSHRSYRATLPLRIVLAWMGTLGFQGSIRWWVLRHRLHHRFTDTDQDPYNAKRGFWFSHIGWIFQRPRYSKMKEIDDADLRADRVVVLQHRYYVPLALWNGILLPATIAHFGYGDFWGGLLYAGYVSRIAIWHVTFCINSFAHWLGEQPYSQENTSRGGLLLALVTQGEGYHNFHHEFPADYRNGHKWYHWDPTKWLIHTLSTLSLGAYGLKRTAERQILESCYYTAKLDAVQKLTDLGLPPDLDRLPGMTLRQVERATHGSSTLDPGSSKKWIVVDGYVVDLEADPFPIWRSHPGGQAILRKYLGRDATEAFHGQVNQHTQAAQLMLKHLCIARVVSDAYVGGPSSHLKLEQYEQEHLHKE